MENGCSGEGCPPNRNLQFLVSFWLAVVGLRRKSGFLRKLPKRAYHKVGTPLPLLSAHVITLV